MPFSKQLFFKINEIDGFNSKNDYHSMLGSVGSPWFYIILDEYSNNNNGNKLFENENDFYEHITLKGLKKEIKEQFFNEYNIDLKLEDIYIYTFDIHNLSTWIDYENNNLHTENPVLNDRNLIYKLKQGWGTGSRKAFRLKIKTLKNSPEHRGGQISKYIKIRGVGKRKLRYQKNGRPYVIVKGKKLKL